MVLPLVFLIVVAAHPWEYIDTRQGVTVWQRAVAGSALLEFRGLGVVEAGVAQVTGVVLDEVTATEWLANCAENRLIEERAPGHAIVYNRTASGVLGVYDRDAVLELTTVMLPQKDAVRVEFWSVEDARAQPRAHVVRLPRVAGFWWLRQVDPQHTEVTYQLSCDPGGALPTWLVNWRSRRMPYDTIVALRHQVQKSRYRAGASPRRLNWNGFSSVHLPPNP